MQIFQCGVNERFLIGENLQVTVMEIGDGWVDLELQSTDDGDSRVVTLQIPAEKKSNDESRELVAAGNESWL